MSSRIASRSARTCFTLLSQALSLGGASVLGQYSSGHFGDLCLAERLNSRMSHWAMRMCSSNCHGVCGPPSGLRPRRSLGKSLSTSRRSTCASALVSKLETRCRTGSVFFMAILDDGEIAEEPDMLNELCRVFLVGAFLIYLYDSFAVSGLPQRRVVYG